MARDITALHPTLQNKIAQLKKLCAEKGLNIGIGECLRTIPEQNALYAQGRTKPGKKVTNARGNSYSSQHQWGIAFDFFKNVKGQAYNDDNFFYSVAALAKSIGLAWGGDWKNPVDKPHLYLPDWGKTTSKLRSTYGTPDKFKKTWTGAVSSVTPDTNTNVTNTPSVTTPSVSTSKGNSIILSGQKHANNFAQCGLVLDGIYGANTKKAGIKVLQRAINLDYNSGLKEDGLWGSKSNLAFGKHYVKLGETQYLVTALEILLMLKGYDPKGVECPGKFGSGLKNTTEQYQKDNGLSVSDKINIDTFKSLIS